MHQDEVSKQIEAFAFARKRSEMHRMIVKAIRSAPDDRDFLFFCAENYLAAGMAAEAYRLCVRLVKNNDQVLMRDLKPRHALLMGH